MRKVVYGENTIEITDNSLTVEQIKESLSQVFSELTNATYEVDGDTITFKAAAGTKGSTRTVVYGDNEIEITDASLSVEQIKESLSQVFSELTNATYEVDGNRITFKAAAGTKGATRTVVYGDNEIEITDASLTVEQIKQSLSQVFSELTNATYEVDGNRIVFKAAAGTKGATRTVVYGDNEIEITDASLSVEQIKESLSQVFSELTNATYEVEGNRITFKAAAGTKGK